VGWLVGGVWLSTDLRRPVCDADGGDLSVEHPNTAAMFKSTNDEGLDYLWELGRLACQGKKTGFLSRLYIKVIFLPRQARDKPRENTKKACFLEATGRRNHR
jgi:hypothetical protein